MFSGIRGRPACDFHFQNNWKPLRCQPIRVSGLTMTKASFQLHKRDQRIREKRAESFNRQKREKIGWTKHGLSGLHRVGPAEKHFLFAGLVFGAS